jgi:hypothetical protein
MKAVNGYLENGRFTPLEAISVSERTPAILVFEDIVANRKREARMAWLERFHSSVREAGDEEMPDFPRVRLGRELVDLSDERQRYV